MGYYDSAVMHVSRVRVTAASWRRCTNHTLRLSRQRRWHASEPPKPPPPTPHVASKAFVIGSLAGLLGSLAGMGGGFVMIPLMTSSLLRLTQHQAHGTSLFAVAATGIAGALGYAGEVQLEAAAAIAVSGMVTARFGAVITGKMSEHALRKALGIFMLSIAPIVPAKAFFTERQSKESQREIEQSFPQRLVAPAMIGVGSGFLAGLFGVGGGAIVVPALTVLTDMTHYQALGTSLCAMCLPAMVGTATHFTRGNVAMHVAPFLAVGSFVGAYLGGKLGLQTNENALRWGFSGVMVVLGTKALRS